MREPVLVSSIDGVGTKLKIAFAMNKHDTVGADLVNHCVNDIAVLGARPLVLSRLHRLRKTRARACFDQLLRGFPRACRAAGCALIGGETAQMPGMYRRGEYDLAGCIVGVVDRANIIDGRKIKTGRRRSRSCFQRPAHQRLFARAKDFVRKNAAQTEFASARLDNRVGKELLRVHKNYQPLLAQVADWHDQRPGPYHRRRSDRQSAADFANKL